MADQVLSVVSNTLLTMMTEEAKLLGGLRQEIQLISHEFDQMKAFLTVAEYKKEYHPQLQVWIGQVREVAYDTEDALDEFNFHFARHRQRGFFGYLQSSFNSIKNLRARHRLATQLQSIKSQIKTISEARLKYESQYGNNIPAEILDRLTANNTWRYSKDDEALYAKESELVGIQMPKQSIISELFQGHESQVKVIAVLGMGGVGKTTLVRKVYSDTSVENHFQIRVWITVSQTYDFKELLRVLIRELHKGFKEPSPPVEFMNIADLQARIRDFLQRKRYVVVFDDVWDRDFWDALKFAFPENSHGGNCVLLTTRIADVASASCNINSHDYVYRMEYLSFEDSMTLFCRKTFKNSCCPDHLKDVVKGIVEKCEGLPLSIVAISGALALKDLSKIDEWEQVLHRLGGESEGTGKLDRAKKILWLSYNDLPPTLKTCLLYTSIFPEDFRISCLYLIQLWSAERFLEEMEGLTIEEVGWNYMKELAERSLIQLDGEGYHGLPLFVHIHDLIGEIILCESREKNLITLVGSTTQQTSMQWPPEKVVRRLVIHQTDFFGSYGATESPYSFSHLRSIITFGCTKPLPKAWLVQFLSNKCLKAVDFGGMQLEGIPNEVFKLYHLTHLNLFGARVKKISKSIKKLQNLEYLNLGETDVRELPVEILMLRKLRSLYVHQKCGNSRDIGFKAPCNMRSLLSLERLRCIDVGDSDETGIIREIGKLLKLKTLQIANLRREDGKEFCSSLEKLTNLEVLSIDCSDGKQDLITILDLNHSFSVLSLQYVNYIELVGCLEKMPPWIRNLQNLRLVNLVGSSIEDDPLESLQHLPNLMEVYFDGAYQGEDLYFKPGGFLKLKKLVLQNMEGLRWVRVEEGAMPNIRELYLYKLPLMEDLPLGIEHLKEFQLLEFEVMNSQLRKKLWETKEFKESQDYRRIAHIPTVKIWLERDGKWQLEHLL